MLPAYSLPDAHQVQQRERQAIVRMLVTYQNEGIYTDMDGKVWKDAWGIVKAWETFEKTWGVPI